MALKRAIWGSKRKEENLVCNVKKNPTKPPKTKEKSNPKPVIV